MSMEKHLLTHLQRIEQYKSRYFEHFGSDNRVDNMIDTSAKKRYNPCHLTRREWDYVDALGAGGRRFESCHLDIKRITETLTIIVGVFCLSSISINTYKSPYCSVSNLINNPNRVAYFVTSFLRIGDIISDTNRHRRRK